MKIKFHITVYTLFLFISCNIVVKEAQNWMQQSNAPISSVQLKGTYFKVGKKVTKTYLPKGFEEYTLTQYKAILDSLVPKEQARNEYKRLEILRDIKGSFHVFYDTITRSTYTINTLPYFNFSKKDATVLLAMIKQNNDNVALQTDLNFKKRTAGYSKNKEFTLFRSIFEIDNFKENYKTFSTSYIISAQKQTFMINLTTPFEVNFDGYIEKMKF